MGREWKPGDVAMVRVKKQWYRALRDQIGWIVATDDPANGDHLETCPEDNYDARPLVVIDFASREQVERLSRAYLAAVADNMPADNPTHLQAALREFANPTPPKPDEPTGLGAVVKDADGTLWVRTTWPENDADNLDKPWAQGPIRRHWQIVAAVKVLSEGVTA